MSHILDKKKDGRGRLRHWENSPEQITMAVTSLNGDQFISKLHKSFGEFSVHHTDYNQGQSTDLSATINSDFTSQKTCFGE